MLVVTAEPSLLSEVSVVLLAERVKAEFETSAHKPAKVRPRREISCLSSTAPTDFHFSGHNTICTASALDTVTEAF